MSIVTIYTNFTSNNNSGVRIGKAFCIQYNNTEYLLTANHNIRDATSIKIGNIPVKCLYKNHTADIAILEYNIFIKAFVLADDYYNHPVSSYGTDMIQSLTIHPIAIFPGDSGMPIVNKYNEIIALCIGRTNNNLCGTVSVDIIRRALQEYINILQESINRLL